MRTWVLMLYVLAIAGISFYVGAVMASGRWNPWRSPGKRRLR